jgi:hypothetical protein
MRAVRTRAHHMPQLLHYRRAQDLKMSDPQPTPAKKKPRRAEPLQPDRSGSGDEIDADRDDGSIRSADESTAQKQQQTNDALKNVREGYD